MPNHTISSRAVKQLFIFLIAAHFGSGAQAVPVEGLYVAEVLVADESARQLTLGARAGLVQVLERVSGRPGVEDRPAIRQAMRDPSSYYYQFSYESTDQRLVGRDGEREARLLQLHFEPSAVARLLREAELPVWGSNRPAVLFWIAVADSQGRYLLGEADESEIVKSLMDQARQRGLPIMLPILDIEDAGQISVAEVWGGFVDRIERASIRYSPDLILSMRLQKETDRGWSARWSLQAEDGWQMASSEMQTADDLVREMIDQLTNEISVRYAVGSSRGRISVLVEGVAELSDYAVLSSYFETLAPVLSSTVVMLKGDLAEFELQVEGQSSQLVELVKLDERLTLLNHDARNARLLYRWVAN